jgi:hypothetical protein
MGRISSSGRLSTPSRLMKTGKLRGVESGKIGQYRSREDILKSQAEAREKAIRLKQLEQQKKELEAQRTEEAKYDKIYRIINKGSKFDRKPFAGYGMSSEQIKEVNLFREGIGEGNLKQRRTRYLQQKFPNLNQERISQMVSTGTSMERGASRKALVRRGETASTITKDMATGQVKKETIFTGERGGYTQTTKSYSLMKPVNLPKQQAKVEGGVKGDFYGKVFAKKDDQGMSIKPTEKVSTGGIYFRGGEAGLKEGEIGFLPSEDIVPQTASQKMFSILPKKTFGDYEKTGTALWLEDKGSKAQEWLGQKKENVTSKFIGSDYERQDFGSGLGYGFYKFRKGVIQTPFNLASMGVGLGTSPKKESKKLVGGIIDLPGQIIKDPIGTTAELGGSFLIQGSIFKFGSKVKAKAPTSTKILGAEQSLFGNKIRTDIVFESTTPKSWGRVDKSYGQARSFTDIKNLEGLQKGDSTIFGVVGKKKGSSIKVEKQFQAFEQSVGKENIIKSSKSFDAPFGKVIKQSEFKGFTQISSGRVAISKGRKFKDTSRGFEAGDIIQDKYLTWGKGATTKEGSAIVGRSASKTSNLLKQKPSSYEGFIYNLKKKGQGTDTFVSQGSGKKTPFSATFQDTGQINILGGATTEAVNLMKKTQGSKGFAVPTKTSSEYSQVQRMRQVQTQRPKQTQKEIIKTKQKLNLGLSQRESQFIKLKFNARQTQGQNQQFKQVSKLKQKQSQQIKQQPIQRSVLKSRSGRFVPMMKVPQVPKYRTRIFSKDNRYIPSTKPKKSQWDIFIRRGGKWKKVQRIKGTGRQATWMGQYITQEYLSRSFRIKKVGERDFSKLRMIGSEFRRPTKKKGKQDWYTAIEKKEYSLKDPFEKVGLLFARKKKSKKKQFLF